MTRLILFGFVAVLLMRLAAAHLLGLYGDEAWYWQCAQQLDFAYADHPFMTALVVHLGTLLFGDTTLGVRFGFVLLGAASTPLVYWLARPLVGKADALLAAGATLILLPSVVLGVVAAPDGPAAFLALVGLCAFERATRTGRNSWWLLAGVAGALSLSTHYRCTVFIAAMGLSLLGTPTGRGRLRTPGPWLALAVTALGALPLLVFNLEHDFGPLTYQFSDRHGASRGLSEWIRHPVEQALVVSPLLYGLLLGTLVSTVRGLRAGDTGRALAACFGLVVLGLYFITSPFTDTSHVRFHWPAPGYLPLLVFLPGVVRTFRARGPGSRRLTTAAFVLAGVVVLFIHVAIVTGRPHIERLPRSTKGWTTVAETLAAHVDEHLVPGLAAGARPLVVADNYITAGQVEFALGDRVDVYVLRHPKNIDHGRDLQFTLWGVDEEALAARVGDDALVVIEISATKRHGRDEWRAHVRGLFDRWEPLSSLTEKELHTGEELGWERDFEFGVGRGVRAR